MNICDDGITIPNKYWYHPTTEKLNSLALVKTSDIRKLIYFKIIP